MIKIILILMFLLVSDSVGIAQISSLRIGDNIPDIEMGKVLNDASRRIHTKEFRGKLLILDFWNIHCANCISAMPKLDSLQNHFADKLQIISVTSNSGMQVDHLFSRIQIVKPKFPFIIEDSVFNLLFPHQGDPLHVWISEEGKVVAITNGFNTNEGNLNEYFSGKMPFLTRRWDYGVNHEYPLLSEANASILNYASQYSVLFNSLEEMTSSNMIRLSDTSIQVVNGTLLQLYKAAYKEKIYDSLVNIFDVPTEDRVILEVTNKVPFIIPNNPVKLGTWGLKNKYCYEIKSKSGMSKSAYDLMQEDLENYFPYIAFVEKRCIQGFALSRLSPHPPRQLIIDKRGKSRITDKKPLNHFISALNTLFSNNNTYFIDRTGLTEDFSIYISSETKSIESLNNDLRNYGLELLPEQFGMNFLIIRDK